MRRARGMKVLATAGVAIVALGTGRLWWQERQRLRWYRAPAKKTVKVGLAYDIGGRGDKSFNDAAAAGLDKAKTELGRRDQGARGRSTARPSSDKDARLQAAVRRRATTRSSRSASPTRDPTPARSPRPPRTTRTSSSRSSTTRRRRARQRASLIFAEEQGSFLVGAAAALKTQDRQRRLRRRRQGRPDQEVRGRLRGGRQGGQARHQGRRQVPHPRRRTSRGFNDPAKGKTAAEGMYDGGADIVYHAAGGSGGGVFEARQGARASWPSASTPTSTNTVDADAAGRHHDLDAQAGRRRGVRLHQGRRRRHVQGRHDASSTSRPTASATPPPAARSTTSRPSSTTTSSRSSTARSRSRPTP